MDIWNGIDRRSRCPGDRSYMLIYDSTRSSRILFLCADSRFRFSLAKIFHKGKKYWLKTLGINFSPIGPTENGSEASGREQPIPGRDASDPQTSYWDDHMTERNGNRLEVTRLNCRCQANAGYRVDGIADTNPSF